MADYYTKLAFTTNLPADAAQYAIELATDNETLFRNNSNKPQGSLVRPESVEIFSNGDDYWHGCIWEYWAGELTIYGEENASPSLVAIILQRTLAKFNLDQVIAFEWIEDCNRPRIDAYTGGAVIVTKDEIREMTTGDWLADQFSNGKLTPAAERIPGGRIRRN